MRRNNKKYLGNTKTLMVHNLDKEVRLCQISKIIAEGNAVTFIRDSIMQAIEKNYSPCPYCGELKK